MRPFAPPAFGLSKSFYVQAREMTLAYSGEYMRHVPTGLPAQWVVMHYQFIPVNEQSNSDFMLPGTNPKAWGHIDHYATPPLLYTEGHSARPSKGSQFEIRGLIYNVKRVDVNHVGYLHIELTQADNCAISRPAFFTEQEGLLCSSAPDCGGL